MVQFIEPKGKSSSHIAFVVDAPRAKDAYENNYFSGYVGDMFSTLLGNASIIQQQTYTTALIKTPLTKAEYTTYIYRNKILDSQNLDAWVEYLRRELSRTSCNVIVPMGELSFYALTGLRKHNKYRGSILPCTLIPGRKVIPCLHPYTIQSQYHMKPIIQCDLAKIKRESSDRIIAVEENNFIVEPTFEEAISTMQSIIDTANIISWDIETAGQAISCIGFATDKHGGICIPLTIPGQQRYWSNAKEREILRMIEAVLRSGIPNGGQNINYDLCWMINTLSIVPKNTCWDTMIASHTCYAELPKDLGMLTSLYTNYPYYKDEGNVWRVGVKADAYMTQQEKLEQYWLYNIKDCHRTLTVWHKLENEMSDLGVRPVHDMAVKKYLPMAVYMTCRGMNYNEQRQAQLFDEYEIEIKALQNKIITDFNLDESFNLGSPQQLKHLFYDVWGMKEKKNRSTGAVTVDDNALKSLKKAYPKYEPFISSLQILRAKKKLQSTYLKLSVAPDHKMRFGYNVVGTETGRWSSSKSCFGVGTNGQNIPNTTRNLITAPKGKVFINADLSQAEARIVAMLGCEMGLLELFESGQDVHSLNAQRIFGIPPEDVKKIFSGTKTYRDIGKRVVHASNYNMSARTFAQQAEIKISDATTALNQYFTMYPGIPRYHRWVENEVRNKGYLTTVFGRKRIFFGRRDATTMRAAYAMIPQSTVGDILNNGAYEVFTKIPYAPLVLQVHDSIMVECPEDRVQETCIKMRELMSIPITINGITHTIPVDFQVGLNWGYASPTNPDGLKDYDLVDTWRRQAGTESGIGARSK